jgi:predicted lipase
MIGVPQLRGNKDVFTRNPISGKSCLQGFAHLAFVLVSFRTIEVSKSSFQRASGSTYRYGCVGNQGAKAECGHMAAAVIERYSRQPKIRRFSYGTPRVTLRSPFDARIES